MFKKIIVCLMATALLLGMAACKKEPAAQPTTQPTSGAAADQAMRLAVYYPSKDSSAVVPEERVVMVRDKQDMQQVLTELMKEALLGPVIKNNVNFFPEGTTLLWISYADGWAGINFSASYGTLGTEAVRVANQCVALAALQLAGVTSVSIYANGELIKTADAQDGTYTASSFQAGGTDTAPKLVSVTVYFPDEGCEFLYAEQRTVEVAVGEHLAKYVMEELMKGPADSAHLNVMPVGAKLLSATVNGAVCTVNFSAEFTGNFTAGNASGTMLIYSIVNSLTALSDIELVRFQVDGAAMEMFAGLDMSEPFSRDGTMIMPEKS